MRLVSQDAIRAYRNGDFKRFDYLADDTARRYAKRYRRNWSRYCKAMFKVRRIIRQQVRDILFVVEG